MVAIARAASDRRAALAELAALEALERLEPFGAFVARVSPRYARVPPHLQVLYDLVEETRQRPVRVAVSMPPRSGKSTTLQHAIAWRTLLDPSCLNLYASYGQDLAEQASSVIRRLALAGGSSLARSKVLDWTTTHGGGLKATSVGGGITGRGINDGLALVDDSLKGREEAESKRERDRVWNWFRDDIMSRLEGIASVFVVQTRWHEDDLIGRLQKDGLGDTWRFVNLPAIHVNFEPVDEKERSDAEPLWLEADAHNPTREGALAWYAKARARGEYSWWSLYQGVPRPREAKVFGSPAYHSESNIEGRVFVACDPAASASTKADYSVAVALCVTGSGDDMRGRVLDVLRGQWEIPELAKRLYAFQQRWYGSPIAVESVGGFKAVAQTLRSIDSRLRVTEIVPRGDKFQRAQAVAGAWNAGRVTLPLGAQWVPAFVDELEAFSGVGDLHDDQVDALSHAWNVADAAMRRLVRPAMGSVADPGRWR